MLVLLKTVQFTVDNIGGLFSEEITHITSTNLDDSTPEDEEVDEMEFDICNLEDKDINKEFFIVVKTTNKSKKNYNQYIDYITPPPEKA